MNFDFGEVLNRAFQVTWKHKVLWLLNLLPMLVLVLILPVIFFFAFYANSNPGRIESLFQNPFTIMLMAVFYIVVFVTGFVLGTVARSSTTLGIIRAEDGNGSMAFMDLLRDGIQYFWKILGVMSLYSFTVGLVFFMFFACITSFIFVTIGMGAICAQPIMLLLMPVSLVAYALMEQAEAAVIADNKSVMDSARIALDLVKAHFWKYVLIVLVVYFGATFVSSLITFPFMFPFFGISFLGFSSSEPFRSSMWVMGAFMLVFVPVMGFAQGVTLTFIKSALTIMYLRLTRGSQKKLEPQTDVS